ncbi:MAG TPA: zinc ribbon domain-containing protein [Phycisphaerae bacterium]|nr:zinc ribbon domain-containing protein [Phycisphaerae bacterium]
MPVYEYDCRQCRHAFEYLHRSNDDKARCPSCGSEDVQRKLSVFSTQSGAVQPCSVPAAGACRGCCDRGPSCPV